MWQCLNKTSFSAQRSGSIVQFSLSLIHFLPSLDDVYFGHRTICVCCVHENPSESSHKLCVIFWRALFVHPLVAFILRMFDEHLVFSCYVEDQDGRDIASQLVYSLHTGPAEYTVSCSSMWINKHLAKYHSQWKRKMHRTHKNENGPKRKQYECLSTEHKHTEHMTEWKVGT